MPQRRQRSDSVTAAVEAFKTGALPDLMPPEHNPLPAAAMPFWHAIVRGRARAEWEETPALISTAASLAWTQWQIARMRGMFDGTIEMEGGLKDAALLTRSLDLQRLEMAYLRTLQQHGRGAQGDPREAAKRRGVLKGHEADSPLGDPLLATPPLN